MVHHKFYFGKMNVEKLVDAAIGWKTVGPQLKTVSDPHIPNIRLQGTAMEPTGLIHMTASGTPISRLEHIQVTVSLTTTFRGRLVFTLQCPSGTKSVLLTERPNDRYSGGMEWTFMTTRCWDER